MLVQLIYYLAVLLDISSQELQEDTTSQPQEQEQDRSIAAVEVEGEGEESLASSQYSSSYSYSSVLEGSNDQLSGNEESIVESIVGDY